MTYCRKINLTIFKDVLAKTVFMNKIKSHNVVRIFIIFLAMRWDFGYIVRNYTYLAITLTWKVQCLMMENCFLSSRSGPVLSRFDRFLLNGPRAKGGSALCLLTNTNLHFLSKLLVYSAGAGSSVFKVIWETTTVLNFFQRSLKIQYKLVLLPPSKYTKTLLCSHLGIQIKPLRSLWVSQNVFADSKVKL